MERKEINELYYNNRYIKLKKAITFFSDGSYDRGDGVKKYGNSNGRYLKMSLYDIDGKEHKVFMHTLMLCLFVSDRPSEEYEVDHKDRNTMNNDVSNLRWVTRKLNMENRDDTIKMGSSLFIREFNKHENKLKLSYSVVHHRVYNLGWSFERAINTPLVSRNECTEGRKEGYNKRKTELRRWFEEHNTCETLAYKTFYARVKRYGKTREEALAK